jgi:hypothetical protein
MANKIDILVSLNGLPQVASGLQTLNQQVNIFAQNVGGAGQKSQGFLDVFKGNLLYNYFRQAASAAYDFGQESVKAYAQVIQDERFLNAQIKETGVNFEQTYASVDKFDHKLALSKDNAEKLYATTLQFLKEIGQEGQADKFITSLSDTLVSHGVSPEQQAEITRSLLAGRATELGKVLGENLQTIEKEISKQAGVDFSKLDDAAKKQLLFNKVLKEGENNAGATAERLGELDGKVASIGAAYDRAKEKAGAFITQQTALKGVVDLLNYIGGGGTEADYQKAKEARMKSDLERAANERDEFLRRQDELNRDPSKRFKSQDYLATSLTQVDPAKVRAAVEEARATYKKTWGDLATGVFGADPAAAAETEAIKRVELEARKEGEKRAKALHDGFIDSYNKLFRPGGGADNLTILDYAKKQFDQIKGILDPAEFEEIGNKLNAAIRAQMEKGLAFLKQMRTAAESEIKTFAEANADGGDNPFAKIYLDAAKAAKDLKERFGGLDVSEDGQKQYAALETAEKKITDARLASARVDAQLSAEKFRRQAEELKNIQGLTAAEERRLNVIDRQLSAAFNVPTLLTRAEAIDRGRPGIREGSKEDAARVNAQIENLMTLQRQLTLRGGRGEFTEQAQGKLDQAIINYFEGLSPQYQRQLSRGGDRGFFSDAYRREAGQQVKDIQREIERGAAADRAIAGIQKDLDIIRRGGLSSAESDKRILAVTGGLSDRELTGDLNKARFDALNRQAERDAKQEEEGKKQADATIKATEDLVKAVDDLAKAARDPENRRILIELINRSKAQVRDALYGTPDELK